MMELRLCQSCAAALMEHYEARQREDLTRLPMSKRGKCALCRKGLASGVWLRGSKKPPKRGSV